MRDYLIFARTVLLFLFILWGVFFFIIGIKMVPNDDMHPRMDAGDVMMYYRLVKNVNTKDVIVLKKNGTEYVGRVVAKGGDTVEITKDANLVVNGNVIADEDIYFDTPMYEGFQDYPITLASDEYYVLSDKRDGGEDSRYYGPVKYSEVKGILILLIRRVNF